MTDPHVFAGHDPSGVPAYVLKGRHVSSSLVRPSDELRIVQRINDIFVVSKIRKSPGRFPFIHKRGNNRVVIFIKIPRNEVPEVRKNSSLQTQRNNFIPSQVLYKQLYWMPRRWGCLGDTPHHLV